MFLSNRRLAALALTAITQFTVQAVQLTNDAYTGITAGSPFTLKWSGNGSPVTLVLATGPSSDLEPVQTISPSATGTSFTFTPPSTLLAGTYAFEITQSGETNYSPQFSIASTASPTSLSAVPYMPSSLPESPPPVPGKNSSGAGQAGQAGRPPFPAGAGNASNASYPCPSASVSGSVASGNGVASAGVPAPSGTGAGRFGSGDSVLFTGGAAGRGFDGHVIGLTFGGLVAVAFGGIVFV